MTQPDPDPGGDSEADPAEGEAGEEGAGQGGQGHQVGQGARFHLLDVCLDCCSLPVSDTLYIIHEQWREIESVCRVHTVHSTVYSVDPLKPTQICVFCPL